MATSSTAVDGFSFLGGKKQIKPEKVMPGLPLEATEYKMNHAKRGSALIFNHMNFASSNAPRKGTDEDVAKLKISLSKLKLKVKVYNDLKKRDLLHTLELEAASDHSKSDCIVVVVLTHGDPEELCAFDSSYSVKKLWESFTADNSPTLAGKPKLFFIQACRGNKVDSGVRLAPLSSTISTRMDGPIRSYTIPSVADILIANATFDGYYAWRSGEAGSWFIQTLCRVLDEIGTKKEICQILTCVNRKVAIQYASHVPDNVSMDRKKQMPNFLSTLTRELYFRS